jgi:hypothetical protein
MVKVLFIAAVSIASLGAVGIGALLYMRLRDIIRQD